MSLVGDFLALLNLFCGLATARYALLLILLYI